MSRTSREQSPLMFPPLLLGLYYFLLQHLTGQCLSWLVSLPRHPPTPSKLVPEIPGSGQHPGSLSGTTHISFTIPSLFLDLKDYSSLIPWTKYTYPPHYSLSHPWTARLGNTYPYHYSLSAPWTTVLGNNYPHHYSLPSSLMDLEEMSSVFQNLASLAYLEYIHIPCMHEFKHW
jgi:hypothetical protein